MIGKDIFFMDFWIYSSCVVYIKHWKKGVFNHIDELVQILSLFVTLFKCKAESYSWVLSFHTTEKTDSETSALG